MRITSCFLKLCPPGLSGLYFRYFFFILNYSNVYAKSFSISQGSVHVAIAGIRRYDCTAEASDFAVNDMHSQFPMVYICNADSYSVSPSL